jgi:hypothetical protein
VVHVRLAVVVDLDVTPFVDLYTGSFKTQVVRIGDRADGQQDVATSYHSAVVTVERHSIGRQLQALGSGTFEKLHTAAQQFVFEGSGYFCVLVR